MKKSRLKSRRGAVAVLVAVLMVVLLAMVSFCVDIGYMTRVNAELQNAADAAALAGASKLTTPQFNGINSSGPAQASIAAARSEAQKFATLNSAGSTTLSLLSSDTMVGYMANPTNQQQTLSAWSAGQSDALPPRLEFRLQAVRVHPPPWAA